jgi:hypothetical protein
MLPETTRRKPEARVVDKMRSPEMGSFFIAK